MFTKCLRCGRKLKSDKAKQLGYGESCYKKISFNKPKIKNLLNCETLNDSRATKISDR